MIRIYIVVIFILLPSKTDSSNGNIRNNNYFLPVIYTVLVVQSMSEDTCEAHM